MTKRNFGVSLAKDGSRRFKPKLIGMGTFLKVLVQVQDIINHRTSKKN